MQKYLKKCLVPNKFNKYCLLHLCLGYCFLLLFASNEPATFLEDQLNQVCLNGLLIKPAGVASAFLWESTVFSIEHNHPKQSKMAKI